MADRVRFTVSVSPTDAETLEALGLIDGISYQRSKSTVARRMVEECCATARADEHVAAVIDKLRAVRAGYERDRGEPTRHAGLRLIAGGRHG